MSVASVVLRRAKRFIEWGGWMYLGGKETIFPMMGCTRTGIQISQFTWCIIKTMRIILKSSLRFILSTLSPSFSTTSCKPIFLSDQKTSFQTEMLIGQIVLWSSNFLGDYQPINRTTEVLPLRLTFSTLDLQKYTEYTVYGDHRFIFFNKVFLFGWFEKSLIQTEKDQDLLRKILIDSNFELRNGVQSLFLLFALTFTILAFFSEFLVVACKFSIKKKNKKNNSQFFKFYSDQQEMEELRGSICAFHLFPTCSYACLSWHLRICYACATTLALA